MNIVEMKGQKGNLIRFIHGDCNEFMKDIDWKHYHLGMVDPPYGIDIAKRMLGKNMNQMKQLRDRRKMGNWDEKIPEEDYFAKLLYVTRNQVIWGGNYFGDYLGSCKKYYIWDKEQHEDLSFAACEFAWTSFDAAPKMIKRSRSKDAKHEKIHDTQKPIYLYDAVFMDLFKWEALKQGDRVLDTHGGSHNIAILAWRYNLNLDIVEINEEFHLAGIKNFKQNCSQLRVELF